MTRNASRECLLVAGALLFSWVLPEVARAQSFVDRRELVAGANPRAVVVADFNGDGRPDLAVANSAANTVSVFLGHGDGTFATAPVLTVGTTPPAPASGDYSAALAVGDFNGDGKPDLVVTNYSANTVAVFLGNGDGTFQAPLTLSVGTNPQAVVVGDFNGDGKADLAVANYGANTLSVFLGNGNGTFQAAVTVAAGSGPWALALGDFNGDGKADLAVASFGSNSAIVLLGNGDGTFQPAVSFPAGSGPVAVVVGDFNGDGKADLALANVFSNNVSVLLGNGNGTFQAAQSFAVGTQPTALAVSDLNGDKIQDLAVSNYGTNSVSVLLGVGDGTFRAQTSFPTGTQPWSLAAGDFNGDGKPDVAVADYGSNSASILLGNGDGTFPAPLAFGVGTQPTAVAVADLNHDGKLDLAVTNAGSNSVSVLLGNGDGTFQAAQSFTAGTQPFYAVAADFNRDGKLDLAVADYGSNSVSVLLGNGDGTFLPPVIYAVDVNPISIAVGDFNRDGIVDLAVANSNSNTVSILIGNGDGTFKPAQNVLAGSGPSSVVVGDFNGDGIQDLAVSAFYGNAVVVLLGNGDGTFQAARTVATGIPAFWLAVGDFNRDGKQDLAVANYVRNTPSTVSVLLGNGNGTFAAPVSYNVGPGPASVAVADIDGDGIQDLAVANYGSNMVPVEFASVLLGNGDGTFRPAQNFGAGGGPLAVAVGDFNGDKKPDLALANYGSTFVSVLLNSTVAGPGTTPTPVLSPAGGTFSSAVQVTITDGATGATIYFTTDGTTPTTSSSIYSAPIQVTQTTTIQAMATASGMANSAVASGTYTITQQQVAAPAFSPPGGTYVGSQLVSLSDATAGATIHYTTDGSTPTTASPAYSSPITVAQNTTINALATAAGMTNSSVATATYVIQVAPPTFSPAAGTYSGPQSVTLSDATGGATIHYTTDGTTPTSASTVYTSPISVTSTTTINAIATASGMANSSAASATYTISLQSVATPTFSPAGGTYVGPQLVTLSDATSGATIHYTTDGTTPTSASTVYTGPISVTTTTTINAMGTASGMANSSVAGATFTITLQPAATPTFSPAGGTYVGPQVVTLSDATSGATIHYTTDGSTPTSSSPASTGQITVTQTTTIQAMATASGMANSSVASATYVIQVTPPTFSPGAGTYSGPQSVTLSDSTSGATIHYTTDGSTPTSSSPAYTGPITVTQTTAIQAMATASGMANSSVASATYTIRVTAPTFSPGSGTYVGSQTVSLSDGTSGATIHYTTDGTAPTSSSPTYSGPITLTQTTTIRAMAAATGMADSAVVSAAYTIRVTPPTFGVAPGTYNQPQSVNLGDATSGATIHYTTDGSTPTASSPVYSGPISVTQTMTIEAIATAAGMADSTVANATYTLQAATPTFDPPGGDYVLALTMSISDASPGVTIHYTRDGSTPTASSPVYTGPILLNILGTTTVKAIAVAPGWSQSQVATVVYNVLL